MEGEALGEILNDTDVIKVFNRGTLDYSTIVGLHFFSSLPLL